MNANDANASRHEPIVSTCTAVYYRCNGAPMPAGQESEVRQFCLARGWSDIEFYVDTASGSKSTLAALDTMMQMVQQGRISRVVCHSLQAFGRSWTNLCRVVEELNRLGVPLLAIGQNLDTSYADCAKALAAVCQFRRSLHREKSVSGLASAKARGIRLGRPATLNNRRAEVLALRGHGKGVREIARELKMPPASVCKIIKTTETK